MKSPSKLNFLIILVSIIAIGAVVYFFVLNREEVPYQVLTPESYPEGSVVSLYKNFPPNFPKELILGGEKIDYSSTVSDQTTDSSIKVSYLLEKSNTEIMEEYNNALSENGCNKSDSRARNNNSLK